MLLSDALSRHRIIVVSVIAISGLATSLFLRSRSANVQEKRIHAEFQRRAELNAHAARGNLLVYSELMAQLATIGSFEHPVYAAMLRNSFEQLLERHPSIAIMEWVPEVRDADRQSFEAENTRINGRPIVIRQRQADGSFTPAPPADFYYPIQYAVPLPGNEAVIGYDLLSAPTLKSLETARETRSLTATPQFTLAQEANPDDRLAVNLIMPVFLQNRDASPGPFLGYIQCILRIHEALAQRHRASIDEALLMYYEDASAAPDERPILYANFAGHEPTASHAQTLTLPAGLDDTRPDIHIDTFPIGGRQWRFIARLNPAWAAAQRTHAPDLILGGGVFATLLLSLLVNMMLVRNREIERTVRLRTKALERTRQLLEQDITKRVAAEKKSRESESLLRGVLDNSICEIFVKDRHGRYILFNEKYKEVLGKSAAEIFGRTDADLFPPEQAARFMESDREVLESQAVIRYESTSEFRGVSRVGLVQKYPLLDSDGEIYAVGGIITDISDRAEAERLRQDYERKLQASQKMESLGVLAGGIAHDFNNILATILGQASLIRRHGNLTDQSDRQIGLIEVAARRASDLCKQMLTYAGKAAQETESIDLNVIVRETSELLAASLPKNIPITADLAPALDLIKANSPQIRQVVMNLIINAADAIKPQSGRVTIRTYQKYFATSDFPATVNSPELAAGDYAVIEFTDTGPGIKPEIMQRIFEPFFTTKFQGRGLGLSTVIGIVHNYGGGVAVTSPPTGGAVFTVLFPKSNAPHPPMTAPPPSAVATKVWGGVLIIDDEEQLRELAAMILEEEGMTIFQAEDGEQALELYQAHQDEIHVALLDLTMPGLSGAETLVALRKINPHLRIIVLSGYSAKDPKTALAGLEFDAFLQKPYEIDNLLREINAVLPTS